MLVTLTKAEMCARLVSIGLTRKYKPYQDEGNAAILLEVRKPVTITDGVMKGVNMDVYDNSTIRVWTSQKKKAADIGRANKFRVRLLDGEAELYIPTAVADLYLHGLGAKVKMSVSPERIAKLAQARASMTPAQVADAQAKRMAGLAAYRKARKVLVATPA